MQIKTNIEVFCNCRLVRDPSKVNVNCIVENIPADEILEYKTVIVKNGTSVGVKRISPTPAVAPFFTIQNVSTPTGASTFLSSVRDPNSASSATLEAALTSLGLIA